MKILLVFLLCFFSGPTALANSPEKASFWSSLFQTKSKSSPVKKSSDLKKRPKNKSRKLLSKETVLASNYYAPKKTKEELMGGLNQQLIKIENLCNLPQAEQESHLNQSLNSLLRFLNNNLKSDPYMISELKLMFGDIKDALTDTVSSALENQDSSPFIFSAFTQSYRLLYNLPENTKLEDYTDDWAKRISKGLKCLSPQDSKEDKKTRLSFINKIYMVN